MAKTVVVVWLGVAAIGNITTGAVVATIDIAVVSIVAIVTIVVATAVVMAFIVVIADLAHG